MIVNTFLNLRIDTRQFHLRLSSSDITMPVLFTEYIKKTYSSSFASRAGLFQLSIYFILMLVPFLIGFSTHGFWLKRNNYLEQPDVRFKHDVIVVMQGMESHSQLTWSTSPKYNKMLQSSLRVPIIRSYETDVNNDGLNDRLDFTLEMPLENSENVHSLNLLLLFDFRLHTFLKMQMESAIYVEHSSVLSGADFYVVGNLGFRQRSLLPYLGSRTIYNIPLFNPDEPSSFSMHNILNAYSARNDTTILDDVYSVWYNGRARGKPFRVHVTVHYPTQLIWYRPGIYEVLKWSWIQFFSIMVIVFILLRYVRRFVYTNQIVRTFVDDPSNSLAEHKIK